MGNKATTIIDGYEDDAHTVEAIIDDEIDEFDEMATVVIEGDDIAWLTAKVALDKRLSNGAIGLLMRYLALGAGSTVSLERLSKWLRGGKEHEGVQGEGKVALSNAQSELKAYGYMKIERKPKGRGQWHTTIRINRHGLIENDPTLHYRYNKEGFDPCQNLGEYAKAGDQITIDGSPARFSDSDRSPMHGGDLTNAVQSGRGSMAFGDLAVYKGDAQPAEVPSMGSQYTSMCNSNYNYLKDATASFAQKEGDASLFNANGKGYDWGKTKPTTSRKGSKSDYSAAAAAADAPQEPAQAPQTASKPAKAKKSTGRTKAEKERAQALVVAFDELLQEKYKYSLTSMGKSAWGETKRAAYSLMDAGYSDEHILAAYVYFRSKFKMGDTHMRLSAVQKHIPAYVAKRENTVSAYEGLRRDRSGMNASSNLAKPKGFDEWAVGMIDLAKMMGDDEPTQDELEREYIEHLDEWIKLGHNNQHLESVKRMRDEFAERVVA